MPFPALVLTPNVLAGPGTSMPYSAEATGIPDNGLNVIPLPFVAAGIPPGQVDPTRLRIYFDPDPNRPAGGSLFPGVQGVRYVGLAVDKSSITLDFDQIAPGVGDCRLSIEIDHTIEGVSSFSTPLIYGSGSGGASTGAPAVVVKRPYAGPLAVLDTVYADPAGVVQRSVGSAYATGRVIGFVSAVDVPAAGFCQVMFIGALAGFVGLVPGDTYIEGTAPGSIVRETDTLNPIYPTAPGSVIQVVGVAATAVEMNVLPSQLLVTL